MKIEHEFIPEDVFSVLSDLLQCAYCCINCISLLFLLLCKGVSVLYPMKEFRWKI